MNTPTTVTGINQGGRFQMDTIFYTLQDFMTHSKAITYIIMGAILILMPLLWRFLTDGDEKKPTF